MKEEYEVSINEFFFQFSRNLIIRKIPFLYISFNFLKSFFFLSFQKLKKSPFQIKKRN